MCDSGCVGKTTFQTPASLPTLSSHQHPWSLYRKCCFPCPHLTLVTPADSPHFGEQKSETPGFSCQQAQCQQKQVLLALSLRLSTLCLEILRGFCTCWGKGQHVCEYAHVQCMSVHAVCVYIDLCVCAFLCMHVCVHMCICVHTLCVCLHVYGCMFVCV